MSSTWEYRLLTSKDVESGGLLRGRGRDEVEAYLNGLGAEGWEIIDIDFVAMEGSIGLTTFSGLAKRRTAGGPVSEGP